MRDDDGGHVGKLRVVVLGLPLLRGEADVLVLADHHRLGLERDHRGDERLAGLVRFPALLQRHQLVEAVEVGAASDGDAEKVGRRGAGAGERVALFFGVQRDGDSVHR
jgi:hypothetical protein